MDKSTWQKIDTAIATLVHHKEMNVAVLLGEAKAEMVEYMKAQILKDIPLPSSNEGRG